MKHRHSRRKFLKAAAGLAITSSLGACGFSKKTMDEPTERQLAWRRKGRSAVALVSCESYEEDIPRLIKEHLEALDLPDLSGKTVLIKPNLVEYHPGRPITTSPSVVAAAAHLADRLGAAKIVIGEGPGHMRDTQYLLEATGMDKTLNKLGLPFVDLNTDNLEKLENPDGFTKLKALYLPRNVVEADAVISVPKLKTHHWVGVTASMKNLFGTVPGRKYGWPKNILHVAGIPNSIMDLVHLIKPSIALVDAVVSMEGDGPINGKSVESGFLALGADPAAVDATCARTMSLDPAELEYLRLAGRVVGNIEESKIEVVGKPLSKLKRKYELPITFTDKNIEIDVANQAS